MTLIFDYLLVMVLMYLLTGLVYMALIVNEVGGLNGWTEARNEVLKDLHEEFPEADPFAFKAAKIGAFTILWVITFLTWGKIFWPGQDGRIIK